VLLLAGIRGLATRVPAVISGGARTPDISWEQFLFMQKKMKIQKYIYINKRRNQTTTNYPLLIIWCFSQPNAFVDFSHHFRGVLKFEN